MSVILALISFVAPSLRAAAQRAATTHAQQSSDAAIIHRAEDDLDRNDFNGAITLLEPFISTHTDNAHAHLDLAFAYGAIGRSNDAIREYQLGLAGEPRSFAANLNLGILLVRAGRAAEAIDALNKAAALQPANASVWLNLGRAYEKLPAGYDRERAVEAYNKAAELNPKSVDARASAGFVLLQMGRYQEAQQRLEDALSLDPSRDDILAVLINAYLEQHGDAAAQTRARSYLEQYLTRHPESAPAHEQLARVLLTSGNLAAAQKELVTTVKLDGNNESALDALARVDMKVNQYADAEQRFAQLLALHPQSPEIRYGLGSALMMQQKFEEARKQLAAAVSLKPDLVEAWGDLATVDYKLGDAPGTLAALDHRTRLKGDDAGSYFLRAITYDRLRDYRPALDNYEKFLQADQGRNADDEFKARHRLETLRRMVK